MTTTHLLLLAIGGALYAVASTLYRNRASERRRRYLAILWTGYVYGYDHAKLGTDRDTAWRAIAERDDA